MILKWNESWNPGLQEAWEVDDVGDAVSKIMSEISGPVGFFSAVIFPGVFGLLSTYLW